MSNASAIASAGHAIGQGIRDRKKNKNERAAITTRLGTIDAFKERIDEFEEMSLGDLRGLEESVLMKRAKEIEDQKKQLRAKQLEQVTQMIANQQAQNTRASAQDQRAQQAHALQMQLGGKQVGAFDANQDMKAQKHKLAMQQLTQSLQGAGDPKDLGNGYIQFDNGHGNWSYKPKPEPKTKEPDFTETILPNGQKAYAPRKGLNINSLLNDEGKKVFANADGDIAAVFQALMGGAPLPQNQPVQIQTEEEFNRLPSGTPFIFNGREGVKR